MELQALRDLARARCHDRCEWPCCPFLGAQLAHLRHRGMGGSPAANVPSNVMWLCVGHHDLLDGRQHHGLRVAIVDCLQLILDFRELVGRGLKGEGGA